jgi:hypothetical protein
LEFQKQYKKSFVLLALLLTSLFLILQVNLPNHSLVASGDMGSQVGGTINENTTWTAANSPYIITNTIQIPENVNLTIESGVTITAQSSVDTMFQINGILQARGNVTNRIIFEGNGISNFFKTNHPVAKGFADLDYCVIRNGQSAFWFDNTGSFNLTNSELSDLSQSSYLWYPSQDTYIEFNTFINSSGIMIGTDDFFSNSSGMVYVRYNLFINNRGFIIDNFASYGLSKILVNNNSFSDTSGVILEVETGSTTADMDASQNYWGTTNTTNIGSMISDKNNDVSCSSYINYLPLLDAPDPGVPAAPTPTPSPTPSPTLEDTPSSTPLQSPAPSSIPNPTSLLTSTPDSTTIPNSSSTPTTTPAIQSPNDSSATDSSSNSTSSPTNATENPGNANLSANHSTIPEFSPLIVLLFLIVAGSLGLIVLRRKK